MLQILPQIKTLIPENSTVENTIELINQNDTLYSQIVAFSNALNQLNS